jgi:hypothetical protein
VLHDKSGTASKQCGRKAQRSKQLHWDADNAASPRKRKKETKNSSTAEH